MNSGEDPSSLHTLDSDQDPDVGTHGLGTNRSVDETLGSLQTYTQTDSIMVDDIGCLRF